MERIYSAERNHMKFNEPGYTVGNFEGQGHLEIKERQLGRRSM